MARAKNTSRADARRRTKDANRADLADQEAADDADEVASGATTGATKPPRKSMFKMPDWRGDLRSLPLMFRTRRLIWVPFIMIAVGFVLALISPGLNTDLQNYAFLYIEYFFFPQALFTYFIGGFLATRASYLIGFLLGLVTGLLWIIVILLGSATGAGLANSGIAPEDIASSSVYVVATSVFLGTVAGWFAGWYRDFLRGMQDRNKQRAADRESQLKAQRAADRQESRKAAKQKPAG